MAPATILVVDDEHLIRWSLKERLEKEGYRVLEAGTGAEAAGKLDAGVDLALLDLHLPDTEGIPLFRRLKEESPGILAIFMTGHSSVETAVQAMQEGAFHYVTKPVNLDEMVHLAAKALETTALRREVESLRASQSAPYSFDRIIGSSPAVEQAKKLLEKIARSPASTVLLTGESGTGKDLAAKAIHYNSDRAAGAFLNITCSALPENLLESELFGHERGAFTDAKQMKKGLLELADGGTVFLDEIGEMSLVLQSKLLRFLEEKTFRRVGGSQDIRVNVRVIAATNRDLEESVRKGAFRDDLYYRLRVMPVELPSLRKRSGDIPLLIRHYINQFNTEFRKKVKGLSAEARKQLESYGWPGNIRELKNAVERAMLLCEGDTLGPDDFQMLAGGARAAEGLELPAEGIDFEKLERQLVTQALRRAGGNQTRAAALLGMNRDQIRYRIEKFGLSGKGEGSKD